MRYKNVKHCFTQIQTLVTIYMQSFAVQLTKHSLGEIKNGNVIAYLKYKYKSLKISYFKYLGSSLTLNMTEKL